mmetsp:Transcript_26152/g.67441  ORF Transcript_26152/g.67441 Transcript_26152/m.67441 type:complete len:148 (-) Transcript_26152:56-499(-)
MTAVRRRKLIRTVRGAKSYQVSFKIRPLGKRGDWTNIVHFTTAGDASRIPAVYFYSRSTRLHVQVTNRGPRSGCDPRQRLPINKTTKVTIRAAHGRLDVFFNRRLVCRNRKFRNMPAPKKPVKVYVGGRHHGPANARVGQLVYTRLR